MNELVANTRVFWETRFASGQWEQGGGRTQTRLFAEEQVRRFRISASFRGTILDFGCGLGDAFPIYRQAYPHAKLIGMDIADAAIRQCRERYGALGSFLCGDYTCVPRVDMIITSNVLEHLPDDREVACFLLGQCRILNIVVPYMEIPRIPEHLRAYDRHAFDALKPDRVEVFSCRGWTLHYGLKAVAWNIHGKNIFRRFLGRPLVYRRLQALFQFGQQ